MLFLQWERLRDWLILALLLAASIATMAARNDHMVRSVHTIALEATSAVELRLNWVTQFLRALNENAGLREQNAKLSSELSRMQLARQENAQLWDALSFKEDAPHSMVPARVVSKDVFGQNSYLTLDVGTRDSVEVDMAVITEHGILGRVVLASPHYCRVLSYLHTEFRVPAEVLPSFAIGIVAWDGAQSSDLSLRNLLSTEPIAVGDTVVTSSTSRIFPRGIPVGIVTEVGTNQGLGSLFVRVKPAASIPRTHHAFVLSNQFDEERAQLEAEEIR